uniref:Uncharacterized protein n=1 Tax=Cacopsylla melanoneura TaxID=428564 RepID=A0A8D8YYP0_9HEMI
MTTQLHKLLILGFLSQQFSSMSMQLLVFLILVPELRGKYAANFPFSIGPIRERLGYLISHARADISQLTDWFNQYLILGIRHIVQSSQWDPVQLYGGLQVGNVGQFLMQEQLSQLKTCVMSINDVILCPDIEFESFFNDQNISL